MRERWQGARTPLMQYAQPVEQRARPTTPEGGAVEHVALFTIAVALLAAGARMLRTSATALGMPVALAALMVSLATR